MRYTVQSGAGEFGSFRVILETAEAALEAAQALMERGTASVRIIDARGEPETVDAFARVVRGHALTPDQQALVAATSFALRGTNTRLADLFYERLFEVAPQARSLFPADLGSQKRKLLDTLVCLVDQAANPSAFKTLIEGLGRRHVAYGARPEHYGPVGEALLHALASVLGDRFTVEVKTAWTTLYLDLAAAMTAACEVGLDDTRKGNS